MKDHVHTLLEQLKNTNVFSTKQKKQSRGTLMFNYDDVLNKTDNVLSRLMRAIFIKENITLQELELKQRVFMTKNHDDPSNFSTARSNLVSSLCRQAVTWNRFMEALTILGYKVDIKIYLHRDDTVKKYKYSSLMQEISQITMDQKQKDSNSESN